MNRMKRLLTAVLLACAVWTAGAVSVSYAETAKATKTKSAGYVASKEGGKYHKLSCSLAANVKPENKVTFATKAQAEKAGYAPCGVCKP